MKKVNIFLAACFMFVSANVQAQDAKPPFRVIEVVHPTDALKSVGGFVVETGKNVCEGACVTVMGIGDIITAPFRAKVKRPEKRTYIFEPPQWEYKRGRFYRLKPPVVTPPSNLGDPVPLPPVSPPSEDCVPQKPVYDEFIPVPLYKSVDHSKVA